MSTQDEPQTSMKGLVEYMARSLVQNPDAVKVTEIRGGRSIIYELVVAPDDKGWVIGKRGRVANAMRAMLHVAACTRDAPHTTIEIV
jgi:uncharacterized protein